LLTLFLVYGQVQHFDFIGYDDPEYVTDNPFVHNGLTADSIKGAFTTPAVGNWIPVTVLSHILVGQDSGAGHIVNVLLHALSAILLFAALQLATQARWPSAFVAAVFALHPLHVESVAWISERKDVLSAFFAFLALYAYVRYTRQPSLRRYLLVVVPFCLGLMSKPMLVTFPFLLLLLDIWPLRRAQFPALLDKLPLILLSAADSVVTYLVQGSAVQVVPLAFRLRSALVSFLIYLGQMFWPVNLAVFYPYHSVPTWQVALACLTLLAVSALAVYWWRTRPYFATGWFWFLGTLIPVVGIVQVGGQAHADRYTYIPLIGLTVMLAWGAAEVLQKRPSARNTIAGLAIAGCTACMALTASQTAYWENTGTLFQHAIEVTSDNYIAQNGLAIYLAQTGHGPEAIPHFEEYLRLVPIDASVHNNLGILYSKMPGRQKDALAHFEAAVRYNPAFKEAQFNLGVALSQLPGRTNEAIEHLDAARRIQPSATVSQMIDRLRARPVTSQPAVPAERP
jgi:tetratricopeptide (TPR) repeat protein